MKHGSLLTIMGGGGLAFTITILLIHRYTALPQGSVHLLTQLCDLLLCGDRLAAGGTAGPAIIVPGVRLRAAPLLLHDVRFLAFREGNLRSQLSAQVYSLNISSLQCFTFSR